MDYSKWATADLEQAKQETVAKLREIEVTLQRREVLGRNINGITAADFVVRCTPDEFSDDPEEMDYSFDIAYQGELHDIYYDTGNYESGKFVPYSWWPWHNLNEDGEEEEYDLDQYMDNNGAVDFIPPGFGESSENNYDFAGTHAEALAALQEYGITKILDGETSYKEKYGQ